MKRLRAASVEDIAAVKGVPESVARDIWQTLRAWEDDAARTQDAAQAPGVDRDPVVHDVQPEG
jgi:excinuclease ABC subunit C